MQREQELYSRYRAFIGLEEPHYSLVRWAQFPDTAKGYRDFAEAERIYQESERMRLLGVYRQVYKKTKCGEDAIKSLRELLGRWKSP